MKLLKLLPAILLLSVFRLSAQHEQVYVPDRNPVIQQRLDQWQDYIDQVR